MRIVFGYTADSAARPIVCEGRRARTWLDRASVDRAVWPRSGTRPLYYAVHGDTTKELGAGGDTYGSRFRRGERSRDQKRPVPATGPSRGVLACFPTNGSSMGIARQAFLRSDSGRPSPIPSQRGSKAAPTATGGSSSDEELKVGHSLVVEANFKPAIDSERFRRFQDLYHVQLIQVL